MEISEEDKIKIIPNLPEDVEHFPFQISGHRHGQGRLALGVLKHKNGNLLKPLFEEDHRAVIELSFYENVFCNTSSEPLLQELVEFLPEFRGTWTTEISGKSINYLCLEDICENFQQPSVLEIKMGRITYDHKATEKKILEQSSKYLSGEALGIRIKGVKLFNEDKNSYETRDVMHLRNLTSVTVADELKSYFCINKQMTALILSGFIHKLQRLNNWFTKQRKYKFIASSLLFAYEGSNSTWNSWVESNGIPEHWTDLKQCGEDPNTGSKPFLYHGPLNSKIIDFCTICGLNTSVCSRVLTNCNLVKLSMIDFAHCYPSEAEDTNYIFGLHTLIDYLKDLLKSEIEGSQQDTLKSY